MKKELKKAIERIRSGKSAIHNDDKEKCKEVVRYMFPNDGYNSSGSSSFYYVNEEIDSLWGCDECLPTNITHFYEASQLYRWIKETKSETKTKPVSLKAKNQKAIDSKVTNYDEVRILTECAEKLKNIGCGATEKTIKNILKTKL